MLAPQHSWTSDFLAYLEDHPTGGYLKDSPVASEPTALAGLALLSWNRIVPSIQAARWLVNHQNTDGSVGVMEGVETPRWPTSLAVILWRALLNKNMLDHQSQTMYESALKRALDFMLVFQGKAEKRVKEIFEHNSELVGWPWVEGTHSWQEPTAFHVLALTHCDEANHPRALEGALILRDRLLPSGGCNYGNTIVLGQELLPHTHSTGIALLTISVHSHALGSLAINKSEHHVITEEDAKLNNAAKWLEEVLGEQEAAASLCWGVMGLTALNQRPQFAEEWLTHVANRELAREINHHKAALLTLAAQPANILLQPSFLPTEV